MKIGIQSAESPEPGKQFEFKFEPVTPEKRYDISFVPYIDSYHRICFASRFVGAAAMHSKCWSYLPWAHVGRDTQIGDEQGATNTCQFGESEISALCIRCTARAWPHEHRDNVKAPWTI